MLAASIRALLFVLTTALVLALVPVAAAQSPGAVPADPWRLCAGQIALAERAAGLPRHLLAAIAKVESGRWDAERRARFAWPWTVTAEGRGRYLPSREAALEAVRGLVSRGVRNIDVGCMQVNLLHHPEAFASLDQAFDPVHNVAYAADFLRRLRRESGSWTKAIGRYHSRTPHLSGRYRLKVFRAWRHERHRANRALREHRAAQGAAS